MNVFVSYSVRDGRVNRDRLRRLAAALESMCAPYIDLLEHKCGGHQPSVWKALGRMDAFLLCGTPSVSRSPWVAAEYAAAVRLGVPIYTLNWDRFLDDAVVPKADVAVQLQNCLCASSQARLNVSDHETAGEWSRWEASDIDGQVREGSGRRLWEQTSQFHDETLPQEGAKTAHFCSTKITEDVRKYAAEQNIAEDEAVEAGLNQKAREFTAAGADVYAPKSKRGQSIKPA